MLFGIVFPTLERSERESLIFVFYLSAFKQLADSWLLVVALPATDTLTANIGTDLQPNKVVVQISELSKFNFLEN